MSKPVNYKGILRAVQEWADGDDEAPEDLEPQALEWVIRKLGEERDVLMPLGVEAKQVVDVKRSSDQSVELVFSSCRAASAFIKALEELKEPKP